MYYYKNVSDSDLEEVVILNYSSGDKTRVEVIRKRQLGNSNIKTVRGFWINISELITK
jgi:hypothetical protein